MARVFSHREKGEPLSECPGLLSVQDSAAETHSPPTVSRALLRELYDWGEEENQDSSTEDSQSRGHERDTTPAQVLWTPSG